MVLITLESSSATEGDSSRFTYRYPQPLKFPGGPERWECAALSTVVYYSWRNISPQYNNDTIQYIESSSNTTYTIKITPGILNVSDIESELHRGMKANNHYTPGAGGDESLDKYPFNMYAEAQFNRVRIEIIGNDYMLKLSNPGLASLLGFEPQLFENAGNFYSNKPVDITRGIDKILVHCSLVNTSVTNFDQRSDIITTFTTDIYGPAEQIPYREITPFYLDVKQEEIYDITIYFTDQLGRPIDFNGEESTVTLEVREKPNYWIKKQYEALIASRR